MAVGEEADDDEQEDDEHPEHDLHLPVPERAPLPRGVEEARPRPAAETVRGQRQRGLGRQRGRGRD